jgi:hypothetical protein
MTYNEKKSLYESIMKEVAWQVKRSLNESYNSSIVRKLIEMTKEISKKNPKKSYGLSAVYEIYDYCYLGNIVYSDGIETSNHLKLGEFTDDCFEGNILTGEEARLLFK